MMEPEVLRRLTAAGLRVWTVSRDGERAVLMLADEKLGIEITPEPGTVEAAILGFERLASAATELAQELRRQAGSNGRTPGVAKSDEWWSQTSADSG